MEPINVETYEIRVKKVPGGTIEVNPVFAHEGEVVVVTVKPYVGKRLVLGSVVVNGTSIVAFSFIMPEKDVVIWATFEDIPE